jgi:hypothetical protein
MAGWLPRRGAASTVVLVMRSVRIDRLLPIGAALVGSFIVACSANVGASVDLADAEVSSVGSLAIVVVEHTMRPGDAARVEAVARFVRMRSGPVDDDALRMVGAAVDMPTLGGCAPAASLARAARPARAVELVDVGGVTLESNGIATNLPARRLPDVADLISGVVYARAADEDSMPARGRYDLKIAGSRDMTPFSTTAFAPGDPSELRIAGHDVRKVGTIALPPTLPVELTWEPGSVDDLVYVDIVGDLANGTSASGGASGAPTASRVRCLVSDNGHAILATSAFGKLEEGSLTIHRVHREPFRLHNVEAGEVRFDIARDVLFTRR